MQRHERQFLAVCVAPLVSIIVVVTIVFFAVSETTAQILGPGLTVLWCLVALSYLGWDSRRRWPGKSFLVRVGKALMFDRD